MTEIFASGGVMMWPMVFIGIGILVIATRAVLELRRGGAEGGAERRLEGLLFWGAMSAALGLLGTVVGLVQASEAIMRAGTVDPSTLAGGIGVTLITLIFGLLLLIVALFLWYALRSFATRSLSS